MDSPRFSTQDDFAYEGHDLAQVSDADFFNYQQRVSRGPADSFLSNRLSVMRMRMAMLKRGNDSPTSRYSINPDEYYLQSPQLKTFDSEEKLQRAKKEERS